MPMATENHILEALKAKKIAHGKALADALELEQQITALTETLKIIQPTAYEKYLESLEGARSEPLSVNPSVQSGGQLAIEKNHKGALRPVILQVLADGQTRDIDQVYSEVNAQLLVPTTRNSIRTTLGIMKVAGVISSPKYGKYVKSKLEADEPSAVTDGSPFSQPSPVTGRN